jgi:hypothetical protein
MQKYSSHGLEVPKQELSWTDKKQLAESLVQLRYVSRTRTGNKEKGAALEEVGATFRTWLCSSDGELLIERYVNQHSQDEIEKFKDMDELILYFEAQQPKTLH